MLLAVWREGSGQDSRAAFRSIAQVTFLKGDRANGWGIQSVNGIAYQRFFTGIGVAADYYTYNSYPVFFDQRLFLGKKRRLFGYGDFGVNYNNGNNRLHSELVYYTGSRFSSGIYCGAGVGLRIPLGTRKAAFMAALGFTFKDLYNTATIDPPCFDGSCSVQYERYQFENSRVELKAGIYF